MKIEFHHINIVSKNVSKINKFYKKILKMEIIPQQNFPRPKANRKKGYNGKIKFLKKSEIQFHIAKKNIHVAFNNGQVLNPVEKGHIAFRTDNIQEFILNLKRNNIPYSDYGTTFAKEWYQVFFQDPEGNIIEVHQEIKNKN